MSNLDVNTMSSFNLEAMSNLVFNTMSSFDLETMYNLDVHIMSNHVPQAWKLPTMMATP